MTLIGRKALPRMSDQGCALLFLKFFCPSSGRSSEHGPRLLFPDQCKRILFWCKGRRDMLPVSRPAFHSGSPAHRRVREKVPGASRSRGTPNRSRPSFPMGDFWLICSRTDSRGTMTRHNHLVLSLLTQQLPQLLVCLVALILILVRWKHAPRSSVWALLGFGLALLLCIVRPLLTVEMVMAPPQDRVRWSLILGLSQIALEVMIYTFLLVAVLIGRSKSDSSNHFAGLPEVHPPPYETRQNTV